MLPASHRATQSFLAACLPAAQRNHRHLLDPASSVHGSLLDRFSQASPLSACASPCQNYLPSSSAPTPSGRSAPNCHPCRRHSKQHALLALWKHAGCWLQSLPLTYLTVAVLECGNGRISASKCLCSPPERTPLSRHTPPPPPPPPRAQCATTLLTAATSLGLLRSLIAQKHTEADSRAAAAGIIVCFQRLTVPPSPSSLHVCAPPNATTGALCCT
jgi:hypothetical protein